MHSILLLAVFMALTATADQDHIDSASLDFLGNDFDVDHLIDVLADSKTGDSYAGDSLATNFCEGETSPDLSSNSDTTLDQAWIDSPIKSRRDQEQKSPERPTSCRNRGEDLNLPFPDWAKKCRNSGYHFELCCKGEPTRIRTTKRDRISPQAFYNVEECGWSTFDPSLS